MKKVFLFVFLFCAAGLVWYLFIKKYDYQFESTVTSGPGALYYELSEWERFGELATSSNIEIVKKEPFSSLTQKVKIDDSSTLEMEWEIEKINDSLTGLKLNIVSEKNQLANRWDIVNPFSKSSYIDTVKQKVLSYRKELDVHQKNYKIIDSAGFYRSPEMNCICSSSKNIPINGKAPEMMKTISLLENYVLSNNLDLKGYPFLKITKWDRDNDLIDFDFCFPVEDITNLREPWNLTIKKYPSQESLKMVYRGNYRLSHIAWFEILYKAEENNIETTGLPMEIYYNNPKINTDELNWKAEIFLPVVQPDHSN